MNQSGNEDYLLSVHRIIRKIHIEEEAGTKRPQEPLEKVKIGKVMPWIVEYAEKIDININGYEHEISNYFIRHVIKSHGNGEKEASRGNLPIVDEDFENIPALIEAPDFIVLGAKRNEQERIIFIKYTGNGTMLYFEEILTGKNNKSLRGNTMYKTVKVLDMRGIIANIGINGKTDVSKIKIADMDGGQTINTANQD